MSKVRTVGNDPSEQKVIDDVAEFGWHCVGINEEGDQASYAFSVGLFHTYKHPELAIFGLRGEVAHKILWLAVDAIRRNEPLDLALPTTELIEGYSCCFAEVPSSNYHEYFGFCRWFYQGSNFPLYQIIWPSRAGVFPWHQDATPEFRLAQPVVAHAPSGA